MQVINHALGGNLPSRRDDRHVAARHEVAVEEDGGSFSREVNSYHSGLLMEEDIATGLGVVARSTDGSVEAIRAAERAIYAVMWHPEREETIHPHDLKTFTTLLHPQT